MSRAAEPRDLLRYAEIPIDFRHIDLSEVITVTITDISLYDNKSVVVGCVTDCSTNEVSEFDIGDMIEFDANDEVLVDYLGESVKIGEDIRHKDKPFSIFK